MKTASIIVHEVFGTKGRTIYGEVRYRGKRLFYCMENNSISAIFNKMKDWAFSNGFSHVKVLE